MHQRIYDSKRQDLVDFHPLTPGEVGLYVCGPTVQSSPHIGHLRSALVYDQMRRWFTTTGLRVTLIRNVTDIDDKILDRAIASHAAEDPEQWWALAYRVEREFTSAYEAIGVLAPTYEPRATANISQMIELIERLIERGHAYPAADGSASVYFDTKSWPNYGELTRQRADHMEESPDSELLGKRDPRDFALWKAHRAHEPASAAWSSPWGAGRPGWHIECSAMAARYLGTEFDIHGGGLDLRFPHHENELAQSTAAGDRFARHWVHNGLVNTGGQKMSKSLGNSLFAHDLLAKARPIVLRYFLGSAHYRSVLEFHPDALEEAAAALSRIEAFLERAARAVGELPAPMAGEAHISQLPGDFVAAMYDDFATPLALAALHNAVRAGNVALDGTDAAAAKTAVQQVVAMLDVLGLDPRGSAWVVAGNPHADQALDALVSELIAERTAARAARDFATGDAIRDRLLAAGVALEDTHNATHWSFT